MTVGTLQDALYVVRMIAGTALGCAAVWVAIGPEMKALLRRLRGPRATARVAGESTAPIAETGSETQAA